MRVREQSHADEQIKEIEIGDTNFPRTTQANSLGLSSILLLMNSQNLHKIESVIFIFNALLLPRPFTIPSNASHTLLQFKVENGNLLSVESKLWNCTEHCVTT